MNQSSTNQRSCSSYNSTADGVITQSQTAVVPTNTPSPTYNSISVMSNETMEIDVTPDLAEIIPKDIWNKRLQDKGVSKDHLTKNTYRSVHIPTSGIKEDPKFYPDLAATAIDLMKALYDQNKIGSGWDKLPKNRTNVKNKIFQRLLALRTCGFDGVYTLDQLSFLEMLGTFWGQGAVSNVINPNDRARLFGIIMTMEEHRTIFERLAVGVTSRSDIDDISMSLERMFQMVAIAFNNENVHLTIPEEGYDVPNIELIDLNDPTRIRITRDWMWCNHVWETTSKQYKAVLKDWFKGTGGGSGLSSQFETWDTSKYEKYGIDPDNYDHTDVSSRPVILMNMYCKQAEPYITLIHKKTSMLLSSKYDPLRIGSGEPGMSQSVSMTNTSSITTSSITSSSTSNRNKRKNRHEKQTYEINEVLGTMMKFCNTDHSSSPSGKLKKVSDSSEKKLEDMSYNELYELNDQYKNHLKFLQEMDMCDDEMKEDIVSKIKNIFAAIGHKANLNSTNSKNVSSIE